MTSPISSVTAGVQRVNIQLRPYQQQLETEIYQAWGAGHSNVMAVCPTGGGKTVLFAKILAEHNGASCAIAHRQELVGQISLALARNRVKHRIIAPRDVVKSIVRTHMEEVGANYYDPGAQTAVAGVDTLTNKKQQKRFAPWLRTVTLWVQDEAHHVLRDNKWGTAAQLFPNAKGLGVTATPVRADGKGLGRHADGLFDVLVEGPTMRDLIRQGYLTDYIVYAPETHMDLGDEDLSAQTGDYKQPKMRAAAKKSTIVGDVVESYLKFAPGKLGITFATDVETATDIASRFNQRGVPAEVVSAETPGPERMAILRRFRNRELLQLVNVDLFGEGFDLPAIEVVSMARPTASFALFAQQAGRALRLMIDQQTARQWDHFTDDVRRQLIDASTKPRATIIDHVNNVWRHATAVDYGNGDFIIELVHRRWTLGRRDARAKKRTGEIPVTTCHNTECLRDYVATKPRCPYCSAKPEPAGRSKPEQVAGDLTELDPAALAQIRNEVARVDLTAEQKGIELASKRAPLVGQRAGINRHLERQAAVNRLRESIAWWAGWQRSLGKEDAESYRRFFFTFGVDVLTAQTLKRAEAESLTREIDEILSRAIDRPVTTA